MMYTYGTLGVDTLDYEKRLTEAGYKLEKIHKLRWFKTNCPPDKISEVVGYRNGLGHAKESEIKCYKDIYNKIWEVKKAMIVIEPDEA